MLKDTIKKLQEFKSDAIIVGFSGGLDSSVLFYLASQIKTQIIAIHINHNISPQADKWQKHCQETANKYNIEFIAHKLNKCPSQESFEAWARKQRMKIFEKELRKHTKPLLLLGHHQDDQAETFILQALRGTGLNGLSAMPSYKKVQTWTICRPLLEFKKQDLYDLAIENNITWVEDDSNRNPKYLRNFIRHHIMPELDKIQPQVSKTLSRSASLCASSNKILQTLLDDKIKSLIKDNYSLDLEQFNNLDSNLKAHLFHSWIKNNTKKSLTQTQTLQIIKSLQMATTGWRYIINNDFEIKVEYNFLKICRKNIQEVNVNRQEILKWLAENLEQYFDEKKIIIRKRKAQDKACYKGRNKKNKLKNLFQELKIPKDKRLYAKIIEYKSEIIAIYPFFVCS